MLMPLILAVKKRPTLYDHTLPGNRNVSVKEKLWKEIAEELNMRESGKI